MLVGYDKNAPRWIIFTLDLGIATFALITAYLLRFNFSIPESEYKTFPLAFSVLLGIRIVGFLVFKTHIGIIRHSSITDFQKIFLSLVTGSGFLAIINFLPSVFSDRGFILPYSVLIIEFLLTMFLMIALRVGVKLIYQEMISDSKSKISVIIYGAGQSGITTKHALDRVQDTKYQIVAFIDSNPSKVGKTLEGVKIYNSDRLDDLVANHHVDELIIAIQNIAPETKSAAVEFALKHDIKAFSIPPVQDWVNGEMSARQIRKVKIEDLLGRKPIELDQGRIGEQLEGKCILVSGAAGSIGSEIVRQVAKYAPQKIVLLDQAESPLYEIDLEMRGNFGPDLCEPVIGDIRDRDRMRNLFQSLRPDIVYHAAAYKHVPLMEDNPAEAMYTNINGTKNLVDLSDEFGVDKFVMVSTDKAVNPTNVMGATKRLAEIYAQAKNDVSETRYVTTRFGNVLGSNGSVIPLFTRQIEQGGPITVTHPEITRFFMTIPEACQLVLEAGMMGQGGEIFIFDMGKSVKIIDLAKKMIKLSGLELGKDIEIRFTGLRPGEKLYEELLADEESTMKTHHSQIMIAKVRKYEFDDIKEQYDQLIALYDSQNNEAIVSHIKQIAPEFISKNSIFSKLDQA